MDMELWKRKKGQGTREGIQGGGGGGLAYRSPKNLLIKKNVICTRTKKKYEAVGEANPLDTTAVSWLPPQRQSFRIILIYFAMSLSFIHITLHRKQV